MAYTIPPLDSKTKRRQGSRQMVINTQSNSFPVIDFTDSDELIADQELYYPTDPVPEFTVPKSSKFQMNNIGNSITGITGIAGTLGDFATDMYNSSKSTLTIPKYTDYHETSLNSLDDVYGMQQAQYLNPNILHKPNANDFGFDWLKKSAQGAAAGSSFGPWGALAGAVIGAGVSAGNSAIKRNRYRDDLAKLTRFNNIETRNRDYAYNQGIDNIIQKRNNGMNFQRTFNINAAGGSLNNSELMGVTKFDTGGTHEINPYGGIPQGVDQNGTPNLVEEGEVKWNDFIFSNRIQPSGDILTKYNTAFSKKFNSYADAANFILDLHKERENNPFDKNTLNVQMQRLADAQEYQKLSNEAAQYGFTPEEYVEYQQQILQSANQYATGGPLGKSWFSRIFQAKKDAASAYDSQGNLVKPLTTDVYRGTENRKTDQYRKQIPSDVWDAVLTFIESYYNLYNYVWEYNDSGKLSENEQNRYDTLTNRINKSAKTLSKYASFCEAYDRVNRTHTAQHFKEAFIDKGHFTGQNAFNGEAIYKTFVNEHTIKSALPALNSARSDRYKLTQDTFGQTSYFTAITPYKPTMVATSTTVTSPSPITVQNTTNTKSIQSNTRHIATTNNVTNSHNIITNDNNGVSYYNADSKRYIPSTEYNDDPTKYPNVYIITNRNGLNGDIDYDNNPNYKSKVDNLTDADWEQIKNNLQELNPNFYGKHDDLQYYKDKALDRKFGPIHRAVIEHQLINTNVNNDNDTTPETILEEVVNDNSIIPITTDITTTTVSTPTIRSTETPITNNKHPWYYTALRTAPIWNNMRAILTQNNPDYTYANQIASTYRPISSYPIGQYQRYQPVDQHYLDTQANQRANTQYGFYRDNTQSASAANAYATLAAANQSATINDAYIRALQTNNQNRNAALQYNNQLDRTNEEARRATQAADYSNYANIIGNSYAAAEQERLAVENARETNMQNLAMNLGDLGRELYDRWRIAKDPTNAYDADFNYQGRIPYFWNPTRKQFEPAE